MSEFLINDLSESSICIGCGLCESVFGNEFVKITEDSAGFFVAKQSKRLDANQIKKLKKWCPAIRVENPVAGTREDSLIWGNYESIASGYATNPEMRFKGSSGGALSAVLSYLINSMKYEGVVQIGRAVNEATRNSNFFSTSDDMLLRNAGSRYSPSSPLIDITRIIDNHKKIVVVGRPCDISALRQYLNSIPKCDLDVVLISFLCAGTPSLKGTEKILSMFNLNKSDVVEFRYRGEGWPGMSYAIDKLGRKHSLSYEDSWGKVLNKHLQFRCKICPDGVGSSADITFGDAWDSDSGYPDFSEKEGQSLIISRTYLGKKIIESAAEFGAINLTKFDVGKLRTIQKYHLNKKGLVWSRLIAWRLLGKSYPKFTNFNLYKLSRMIPIKITISNMFGTLKRIVKI
ncbi:MAG: Coenzyme F420 hydrogenase/dehydrogenase, beta subunit C-terminal domain [Melioribacteraceae bacterium]|nr:Coenzyme F420 hydrogenase/dehydrogenase, beta subunit C-terminal domain [Melioribacteraceae bacterium]MCF8263500.1 Coenzyme F420 hydrogenase/dehydrogenase, beta subunit C-terminal domain [Melioribacteraceae bacterium]MCF8296946.1 Coenzyme F420 hydrogenase/dehydrogenase, beta subunit C-terminal domain [Saprospiraceae bacterium]